MEWVSEKDVEWLRKIQLDNPDSTAVTNCILLAILQQLREIQQTLDNQ